MADAIHADDHDMVRHIKARVIFFAAITFLYISFGTVLGFVQGGLPPILRARGLDVATVGAAFLLYVPIGLSFLWAPLIDRHRIPLIGPRSGWIVAMQAVALLGLVVLSTGESWPLGLLFAVGLGVTVAVATMDIALEALIVDSVNERQRAIAAACKIASFCVGAIFGGGVIVALTDTIGWRGIFFCMVALGAIGLIAALLLGRFERRADAGPPAFSLGALVRRPRFLKRLALTCALFAAIVSLFALNRVALIDLGMSLEANGWIVGTIGPLVSIVGALLAAACTRTLGTKPVLYVSAAGAVVTGTTWAVASANMDLQLGTIATLVGAGWLASVYTLIYAAILRWSVGPTSATDYAVLFSLGNLAGLIAAGIATQLIALLGWPTFYVVATVLFVIVVAIAKNDLLEADSGLELETPSSRDTR